MKNLAFLSLLSCAVTLVSGAHAQTVATDPVGAVNITVKGNSDTIVAVPLTPAPDYSGQVSTAAAAGQVDRFNLNVTGTTNWTSNQFASLYYVRMTSGVKNGMYYTVVANTANQLTLDTAGDTLTGVTTNDTFKVFKYWTLATLFPPASAGTAANPLTASASNSPLARNTEILIKDPNAVGINIAAAASYYFTSSHWYVAGTNAIADSIVVYPDNPFTIRQPNSVLSDVIWTSTGAVALTQIGIPLSTRTAGPQDNAVALVRPLQVKLSDLGLDSAFVQSASTSPLARQDELLVFDNTVGGINKSAAKAYYRTGGVWRRAGDNAIADSEIIRGGDGFTIRKAASGAGSTVVWLNTPNY